MSESTSPITSFHMNEMPSKLNKKLIFTFLRYLTEVELKKNKTLPNFMFDRVIRNVT